MLNLTPKKLFLIDGLGALISAFLLGIILVRFESFIGIPARTLYILAAIPVIFALYDIYAYQQADKKGPKLLKGIAYLNLFYCLLSIGFAIFHHQQIRSAGWVYICSEIIIILVLARLELKVARNK